MSRYDSLTPAEILARLEAGKVHHLMHPYTATITGDDGRFLATLDFYDYNRRDALALAEAAARTDPDVVAVSVVRADALAAVAA